MLSNNIPRLIIAGTNSGVGKTTIVTGLLGALKRKGLQVQAYKIGPDYIDPSYHRLASGKNTHNLDTWLVPADKISSLFINTAAGNDIAIIEGVMGLYDGGKGGISSTAAISKLLKTPVILVIDAKSMGESAAAIALGYKLYDQEVNLAGVIINRAGSQSHCDLVSSALANINIPVLGCLFRNDSLHMPERHLGLTPAAENKDHQAAVDAMIGQIAHSLDLSAILALANSALPLHSEETAKTIYDPLKQVQIGIAQDEAFSFYYPESLEILHQYGAVLIPFSPIHDQELPANIHGIILGGGFPEMFVEQLEANSTMRNSLLQAAQKSMPIYAECGGFMYLSQKIIDFTGKDYEMVGAIPGTCLMETKLQTVGYVEAKSLSNNILGSSGMKLRGHEFHFSRMTPQVDPFPWAFEFKKMRTGQTYHGGFANKNILASYLHMHFAGNQQAAEHFINQCRQYMLMPK